MALLKWNKRGPNMERMLGRRLRPPPLRPSGKITGRDQRRPTTQQTKEGVLGEKREGEKETKARRLFSKAPNDHSSEPKRAIARESPTLFGVLRNTRREGKEPFGEHPHTPLPVCVMNSAALFSHCGVFFFLRMPSLRISLALFVLLLFYLSFAPVAACNWHWRR
ncbi:uncharacterized protein TM35_000221870 [Trypanosoma theileri]|uniref:Transmembrane protein n=1 Tax=Trypanosoma theileri TaxID=67003 RepID=A0A1X0NS59_9TRYP|nr:uncharacterized protein TM35_000221870 [Trypanosoma theileri]ORC87388.1 hypothetical protein TM35_000221870 [Trypanosoma theileri]